MNTYNIALPKDTFISNIEPFKSKGIPTNSIIHKEITGCGITTYEIRFAAHHSIIILPNVPVIETKVEEHNSMFPEQKIFGVYKGKTVNHIKAYLLSDVRYKKILTTPEGFIEKVLKAFNDDKQLYNDFFLLYDECDRIITDISYRGAMAAPIKEFIKFTNKALVSATTLTFSDPRLKDFDKFTLVPDYDFRKNLTLISTNNVVESLKKHLDERLSQSVCIFFNSSNGINAIIRGLDIEDNSKVFCADNSVANLFDKGFKEATDEFSIEDMTTYNFFTSRYFSAFDIKLNHEPDVILITDVVFAKHSILDPQVEVIQIAGRMRNGVNSLTHITNYKADMKVKSREEAIHYLDGCFDTYNGFVKDYNNATNPGKRDSLQRAIEDCWANSFYLDGEVNPFMVDNYVREEQIKAFYLNPENLLAAYRRAGKHFNLTHVTHHFAIDDADLFDLVANPTKKEKYRIVAEMFYKYKYKQGFNFHILKPVKLLQKLSERYPEISEAVRFLDAATLEATDFVLSNIRTEVDRVKYQLELKRVSQFVYKTFDEFSDHSSSDLKVQLQDVYESAKTTLKPTLQSIYNFFEGERTTRRGSNRYMLKERKFPIQVN